MVLVITEDELSFHDAPQMMYSGYSSAQSSERTVTKSWSASFDLDSTNHELENVHGSYITIQEEEYICMKETIEKAMNKNYLLQGEVTSLTKTSSSSLSRCSPMGKGTGPSPPLTTTEMSSIK